MKDTNRGERWRILRKEKEEVKLCSRQNNCAVWDTTQKIMERTNILWCSSMSGICEVSGRLRQWKITCHIIGVDDTKSWVMTDGPFDETVTWPIVWSACNADLLSKEFNLKYFTNIRYDLHPLYFINEVDDHGRSYQRLNFRLATILDFHNKRRFLSRNSYL